MRTCICGTQYSVYYYLGKALNISIVVYRDSGVYNCSVLIMRSLSFCLENAFSEAMDTCCYNEMLVFK